MNKKQKLYGIVYKIVCKITNLCYIGQTITPLKSRWKGHCDLALKSDCNRLFSKAIREYGKENFDLTILSNCETKKELNETERRFIKENNSVWPNGYNMTNGGEGPCELTRKKISERTKESMSKLDNSWKDRQREAMKNPDVRKMISENTKEAMQSPEIKEKIAILSKDAERRKKISDKLKGHVVSEETKRKISERTKEAMANPDVRKKISDALSDPALKKQISDKLKGRVLSEETKKKISERNKEVMNSPEIRQKISDRKNVKLSCIMSPDCILFDIE